MIRRKSSCYQLPDYAWELVEIIERLTRNGIKCDVTNIRTHLRKPCSISALKYRLSYIVGHYFAEAEAVIGERRTYVYGLTDFGYAELARWRAATATATGSRERAA